MKKQFFAAAMILALGAGFTACSSDDLNVKEQKEVSGKDATTYMTYTFSVPSSGFSAPTSGTRAASDNQDGENPGNNHVGKYNGTDAIKGVIAYVFNGTGNTAVLEAKQELGESDLVFTQDVAAPATDQPGNVGKTIIKPKKALKVSVGEKTVFLVVNPNDDVKTLLNLRTLGDFKVAYNSAALTFTGRSTAIANPSTDAEEVAYRPQVVAAEAGKPFKTAADVIAKLSTTGSEILMTGASQSKVLAPNVTEDETKNEIVGSSTHNRFNFEMKRAVATVIVSTKAASYDIKGDNPEEDGLQSVTVAKISKLTFAEAQGEQKLYFLQQSAPTTDAGTTFQTPAYSYVTTAANYNADGAGKHYDYNGLWRTNTSYTENKYGVPMVTKDLGTETALKADNYKDFVAANVGVPVLPATHKFAAEGGFYKEGNTAYVLVRGYITPTYVYKLQGDKLVRDATWNGKDLYQAKDGKFYASLDAAKKVGTEDIKVFKDRICLYFVWLNPDQVDKTWKNSPTVRNNIYHISINNIATIGESHNPLVPTGTPNPNPKPGGDTSTNNHKPENNISPDQTWMSVDATIVPWAFHSYGVEL